MPLDPPTTSIIVQDWKTYENHCANIGEIIAASISQGPSPQLNAETARAGVNLYLEQTNANAVEEETGDAAPAARTGYQILRGSTRTGGSAGAEGASVESNAEGASVEFNAELIAIASAERHRISLLQRVGAAMGVERHQIESAINGETPAESAFDEWAKDNSAVPSYERVED